MKRVNIWEIDNEDFDYFYVLKVKSDDCEKYFFSKRVLVGDIGLAKQFNTMRSVKRSIKLFDIRNYKIEKIKREF